MHFHQGFYVILFLISSQLCSQDSSRIWIDIPTTQKPWNSIDWNNDADRFQFAIVTDRTGGHRPGIFPKGIRKLNLLQPEFVMSVGDLIEGYTEDIATLDKEWKEFNGFIDSLQVPFFYVPGNHDITNAVMEEKWKELFGVTYYHFVYKDVLFMCLNSEDNLRGAGKGTIDDEQYAYIQKTLAENQDVKWTLVFLHQPLWIQEDTKRWKEVESLLVDRPHNVFAGHYHRYWKTDRNNGKYIALATTGGGSRLRGTAYGEFDHVVWVTMTEEGPLLANILLDGVLDENIVTNELVDLVRNRPFPVEIRPVYVDDPANKNTTAEVRITNRTDYPMTIILEGNQHADLFYQLDKSNIDVPPNDVRFATLSIENMHDVPFSELSPITISAEVVYDKSENTEVAFSDDLLFLPVVKNYLHKSNKDIVIDGNLDDWSGDWTPVKNVKGSPFDYVGEDDLSMSFATSYDDKHLYVALKIKDNDLYQGENLTYWQQDMAILALDARDEMTSSINSGSGRGKEWIALFFNFYNGGVGVLPDKWPEGTVYKVNVNEDESIIEVALPISYVEKYQGKDWKNVRLGIGCYDFDEGGESRTENFWYPAWNSSSTIHGSGMFYRK